MIGLRQFFIYLWVCSFVALTVSCAEESTTEEGDNMDNSEESMTADAAIEDQVHYQVPSPHEMMDFIKLSGTDYHPEVLCKTDAHEKFVDNKGRAIGMGVFIADLAYTSSFSKFQESIKYFNVVVKMADDIGIGSAFNENMIDRVKNNLDNSDSLEIITDNSYYKIINELEINDRGKIVAMIAAGGWLESVYIATQLVNKFDAKHPLIERIAGQKLVYENIMAYLDQYKDDQSVEWTINDMKTLQGVFDQMVDNSEDTKFTENKNGKRVLGGKGGVQINQQKFEELRSQVAILRNALTFNSPAQP